MMRSSFGLGLFGATVIAPVLFIATAALAAAPPVPAGSSVMLDGASVSAAGRALYTYDRDTKDSSACIGQCTNSWLPVLAGPVAASGDWSVISRTDGGKQWAYKGKPVYAFFRDAPGQAGSGDNKIPGWRLLK
jgi:predicted lipoprotein with Yx(FWY)xxD motif